MMYLVISPRAFFAKKEMILYLPFFLSMKTGEITLAFNSLTLIDLKYSFDAKFRRLELSEEKFLFNYSVIIEFQKS